MTEKNEILVGKSFKSDLEEWKDSIIKVKRIFLSDAGIVFAKVEEFFTGDHFDIMKEKLESALFFEVEQTKESVEKVKKFAKEKAGLKNKITKLKKAYDAITDVGAIPGREEFQKTIADRIKKWSETFESMKENWKMKLFESYEMK